MISAINLAQRQRIQTYQYCVPKKTNNDSTLAFKGIDNWETGVKLGTVLTIGSTVSERFAIPSFIHNVTHLAQPEITTKIFDSSIWAGGSTLGLVAGVWIVASNLITKNKDLPLH